jgi:hypothetical protein
LNTHVRNVEYVENGCERLNGTLYMTIFRLVFAPDNELGNNNLVRIILRAFFKLNSESRSSYVNKIMFERSKETSWFD